jgi:hypothetical protein
LKRDTAAEAAEPVERRALEERNSGTYPKAGTQRPAPSEEGRARIRAVVRGERTVRFNNLLHPVTVTLLWEAYDYLEHKVAPGVDGVARPARASRPA